MNLTQLLQLLLAFISPIVTVWISIYIQEVRENRNRKFSLFLTLISTRPSMTTEDQIRAFNSVDILFYKYSNIRKRWRKFLEVHSQVHAQAGRHAEWELRKTELLKSIAEVLGYKNCEFR